MEGIKKVFTTILMVIGLIWLAGVVISVIPTEVMSTIITVGMIFFTIYGIRAFVKNHKEGS